MKTKLIVAVVFVLAVLAALGSSSSTKPRTTLYVYDGDGQRHATEVVGSTAPKTYLEERDWCRSMYANRAAKGDYSKPMTPIIRAACAKHIPEWR
jgi:hypothetical protein